MNLKIIHYKLFVKNYSRVAIFKMSEYQIALRTILEQPLFLDKSLMFDSPTSQFSS